jgi:hypothetical protein
MIGIEQHGVGGSSIGYRNIKVFAATSAPVGTKYGDVWIRTSNVIGKIKFQEAEPSVKAAGDIWISVGSLTGEFNIKDAMKFVARTETSITIDIDSVETYSSNSIELWKSNMMSLYAILGSVRYWDGSQWIFNVAYFWDGAAWVNFSQDNFNVYVLSSDSNVYKVLADGTFTSFYDASNSSGQIEIDSYENIYVTEGGTVKKFNSSKVLQWTYTGTSSIIHVRVGPDLKVYINDGNTSIKTLSSDGVLLQTATITSTIRGIRDIAIAPSANMLYAICGDRNTDNTTQYIRLYRVSLLTGAQVQATTVGSKSSSTAAWSASAGATDETGMLYVVDHTVGTIDTMTPDGTFSSTLLSLSHGTMGTVALAIDKEHNKYTITNIAISTSKMTKYTAAGAVAWVYTPVGGGSVNALSVDKNGYSYVGEGTTLTKLNPDGVVLWTRTIGTGTSIADIACVPGSYGNNPSAW